MMDILVIRISHNLVQVVLIGNSQFSHGVAKHVHVVCSLKLDALYGFVRYLVLVDDVNAVSTYYMLLTAWHDYHAS